MRKILLTCAALSAMGVTTAAKAETQSQAQPAEPAIVVAPASAQSADAADIVVTARQRSESVQNVPITVTALSGQALTERGLTQFTDLPQITSGLQVRTNVQGLVDFRIRGLGTGGGNESFEQSVALFIDGSFAGRAAEYSQPLFDLERVEVIKGTQAALLPKNTSLGAISITTRKPGSSFAYDLSGMYEFQLDSYRLVGGIDIPLSDTFSVRVSGQADRQGGYVRNLVSGIDDGRSTSEIGRIVALWRPSSDTKVTGLYQRWGNRQLGIPLELIVDNLGYGLARANANGQGANYEARLDRRLIASDSVINEQRSRTKGQRAILTIDQNVGESTLTSVTAYSDYDKSTNADTDYYVGTFITSTPVAQRNYQITQELRFTSPAEKRFNLVAGVFGIKEVWRYHRLVASQSPGLTPAQGGTALTGTFIEDFAERNLGISGFAQANYRVVNSLTFTLGGRLTHEDRQADFDRHTIVPGLFADFLYPAILPTSRSYASTSFDGSASIQYKPFKNVLVYGSFSRGTKGGGFFSSPTTPDTAVFIPERADTFEGGLKLGRGRTFFNINGFHTKISNFQQSIYNGAAFIASQQGLTSKGFETEASIEPVRGLVLSGSVTYADAVLQSGDPAVNAPKWSAAGNVGYSVPVGNALKFDINGGLNYRSRVFWGPLSQTVGYGTSAATTVLPSSDPTTEFNARVSIGREDGRWQLSLIGRNLSDTLSLEYATPGSLFNGAGFGSPNRPRTIALQLTVKG